MWNKSVYIMQNEFSRFEVIRFKSLKNSQITLIYLRGGDANCLYYKIS